MPETGSDLQRHTLWISWAALLVALAALISVVWFQWHPLNGLASPTEGQVAEARARACQTYSAVSTAVSVQTQVEQSPDRVEAQAIAANARLSMVAGSDRILTALGDATPPELADLMRKFAATLQDLALTALTGAPDNDPGQIGRMQTLKNDNAKIVDHCR